MDKNEQQSRAEEFPTNKDQQAVDKAPGEGVGQEEQVTLDDLKGKKVDRDLSSESDEPLTQGS